MDYEDLVGYGVQSLPAAGNESHVFSHLPGEYEYQGEKELPFHLQQDRSEQIKKNI